MAILELKEETKTKVSVPISSIALAVGGLALLTAAGWFSITKFNRQRIIVGVPEKIICADEVSIEPSAILEKKGSVDVRQLHNNFLDLQRRWRSSNRRDLKLGQQLQATLQARKSALLATMRHDPDSVANLIATADEIADANLLSTNCIEQPVILSGQAEVIYIHESDATARVMHHLVTPDNQRFPLHLAGYNESLSSNQHVTRVSGVTLNREIFVDARPGTSTNNFEVQTLASAALSGQKKALVIFWYYGDDGSPAPTDCGNTCTMPAEATSMFTSPSTQPVSVVDFYAQDSYTTGGSTTGITVVPQILPTWYNVQIPRDIAEKSCLAIGGPVLQRVATADPNFDFSQFSHLILVGTWEYYNTAEGRIRSCGRPAGTVGLRNTTLPNGTVVQMSHAWFPYNYGANPSGFIHELGHGLGWIHANFNNCGATVMGPAGCTNEEYGDYYSNMGSTFGDNGVGRFGYNNAVLKDYLGWFDNTRQIINVNRNTLGTGIFTLVPIESQTAGIHALKIQHSANDYLYIEYRQPIGVDSGNHGPSPQIPGLERETYFDGGLFHLSRASGSGSYLLDMTPPPEALHPSWTPTLWPVDPAFVDPLTGAQIKIISNTKDDSNLANSRLVVQVTLPNNFDFEPPTAAFEPPTPTPNSNVSGPVDVAVHATDDLAVDRVEFTVNYSTLTQNHTVTTPTSGTAQNGIYTLNLDTNLIMNGSVSVTARAYDAKGNTAAPQTRSFIVANTDGIPPTININTPANGGTYMLTDPYMFIPVTVSTNDNVSVCRVDYYIDNNPNVSMTSVTAPFTANVFVYNFGPHRIRAVATDCVGNTSSPEATVNFTFRSSVDQIAPTVTLTAPQDGARITGTVFINGTASDPNGISLVEVFVDNSIVSTVVANVEGGPSGPVTSFDFSNNWNTNGTALGFHTIAVGAWDRSGNYTMSPQVTVEILSGGGGGGPFRIPID